MNLEATVTDILYDREYGAAYKIRLERVDDKKTNFSCLLETEFPFDVDAYEKIEFMQSLGI